MPYEWIVEALAQTWGEVESTLRNRPERAYDAATPCPGWSVRDVVSHLVGTERIMQGDTWPETSGPWPVHVKNHVGEMNEAVVAARRHVSGADVLEEFRRVTQRSLRRLRSLRGEDWEAVTASVLGPRPMFYVQETRVVDSWIHLQDIRDALLEPDDDHGVGEEIVLNRFEAAVPYVWGKLVQPEEGSLLRINLIGRLGRSVMVRIEEGRAVAVASTSAVPDLDLTTATALYWRACAGRISGEALLAASATDVRGDKELAQRLARSLAIVT